MMLQQIQSKADVRVMIDPRIFNEIYLSYLDSMARVQIFYGGASSGKSVFLAQRCIIDILRGGRNYLVCRAVGKTIRRSVFNEIKKVINNFKVQDLFEINKTEFTITCANGFQIFFIGLDDVEKVKSISPEKGAITDIWIEEATETDLNTVKSLTKRQRGGSDDIAKRLTLSFNPILQNHWIFDEYFKPIAWDDTSINYTSPELSILKTWFEHNRFLTEQDKKDLLNETDKYYSDVYTWGKWGVLGNVIFTNWHIEDLSGMRDQFTNRRHGGDFGFAHDPAAFGSCHLDKMRKKIYVYEEFCETGLTNDELATEVLTMLGNELITWDSAEPKSIKELQLKGVNARGAKKGPDSVLFSIQWLQGHEIIVDKSCINIQNELRQMKWKEGVDGKPISPPRPVDANNHCIDGILRYGLEDDMLDTPRRGRQWNG